MTNVADGTQAEAPSWRVPWTRGEGAERASSLFTQEFGYAPQAVTSAPGRLNVIGEHTDYSHGLALPTVIEHRTFVAASPRVDSTVRVVSAQAGLLKGAPRTAEFALEDAAPGCVTGWPAYVVGTLWAMLERGFVGGGIDIAIDGCVPIAVGLSSSSSLMAAVALAAERCWGLALDSPAGRAELAEVCVEAESGFVGVPTGGLDQHTVLRCNPGEALLLDFIKEPPHVSPHPLYFPEYGLSLLVIDTHATHDFSDGEYAMRWESCKAACEALGVRSLREVADAPHALRRIEAIADPVARARARHVVTEIERVRLVVAELSGTAPAHERFVTIGKALYRSHASLEVDYEVSGPELNAVVDAAFRSGALGARLVGGGFGGAAFALVRRAQAERTARLIADAVVAAGFAEPSFLMV